MKIIQNSYVLIKLCKEELKILDLLKNHELTIPNNIKECIKITCNKDVSFKIENKWMPILGYDLYILYRKKIQLELIFNYLKVDYLKSLKQPEKKQKIINNKKQEEKETEEINPQAVCNNCGNWDYEDLDLSIFILDNKVIDEYCKKCKVLMCHNCAIYCIECYSRGNMSCKSCCKDLIISDKKGFQPDESYCIEHAYEFSKISEEEYEQYKDLIKNK